MSGPGDISNGTSLGISNLRLSPGHTTTVQGVLEAVVTNSSITVDNSTVQGVLAAAVTTASITVDNTTVAEVEHSLHMQPLTVLEIVSASFTALIGVLGVVLNLGVFGIAYKARLVRKDYRMIYYLFMTFGDLLVSIGSCALAINIIEKKLFTHFGVCLTLVMVTSAVAYQWSAICIILLLIDLVWSIKRPFSDEVNKRIFSKVTCVGTFILGLLTILSPFLVWNDAPYRLPKCTVPHIYGEHLPFYQKESVTVLGMLFLLTFVISLVLLSELYKKYPKNKADKTMIKKSSVKLPKRNKYVDKNVSVYSDGVGTEYTCTSSGIDIVISCVEADCKVADLAEHRGISGLDNNGCIPHEGGGVTCDVGDNISCTPHDAGVACDVRLGDVNRTVPERAPTPGTREVESANHQLTQFEQQRLQFVRACRTVALFMITFIGFCLPYFVWMLFAILCGTDCDNTAPMRRLGLTLVAACIYLLPIVDPILYTQRFELFRHTAVGTLRQLCSKKTRRV